MREDNMFKKVTAIILSAVMLLVPLTGCSMGAKKEIDSTVDWYLSTMTKLKYEKASEYVMGEDNNYLNYIPSGSDKQIVDALLANCEYEIGDETVSMADGEASADVTFTFADVHQLTEDGISVADLKSEIRKMKKTTEEVFTVDLIKDGSHWFIDPDSATEFMIFMGNMVEGLEVMGLSDTGALAYADQFVETLRSGDIDAAMEMNNGADLTLSGDFTYMYLYDMEPFYDAEGEMLADYYSSFDYTASIIDSQEDYIRVSLTGQAPDISQGMENLKNDMPVFAPLYGEALGDYFMDPLGYDYDTYDYDSVYISYLKLLGAAAEYSTTTAPFSFELEIAERNNGELYIASMTDLIPASDAFSYGYLNYDSEIIIQVLDQLLEDGLITRATYEYDIDSYGLGTYVEGMLFTYSGTEMYNFDAYMDSDKITMNITTWGYYNTGDTFKYDVYIDGVQQPGNHTITVNGYDTDDIVLEYPLQNCELPAGDYVFDIYEEGGGTSNVIITISFHCDGIVMSENYHTSGVVYDTSDDFYSLSSYLSSDFIYETYNGYAATSDGMYIMINTWSFNTGLPSEYTYEITRDDEVVATGTAEYYNTYSDQIRISYREGRSGGLTPGVYIVTVYEPDGSVLCRVNYNVQ
ncbi:MAG: hypothetical protein IKT14_00915 [Clostridiales bacterium]|nr:hypothetical protein [Clostridiales bacterium]